MSDEALVREETLRVATMAREARENKQYLVALFFWAFRRKLVRIAVESRIAPERIEHSPFIYVIR